jgi:hypothetical protein
VERKLPVELAPVERKLPDEELATMDTEVDLGCDTGGADADTYGQHESSEEIKDSKVTLSTKQRYVKFKKEADLLSRM